MLTYVLTTLASFGIVLLLSRQGFECEHIDDLKGLNRRSPWHAAIVLLLMFSLAGIPPLVGFWPWPCCRRWWARATSRWP